jgi:hypothetical protein
MANTKCIFQIRCEFFEVAIGDFGNRVGRRTDWPEFIVRAFYCSSFKGPCRPFEDGAFCLSDLIAIQIYVCSNDLQKWD